MDTDASSSSICLRYVICTLSAREADSLRYSYCCVCVLLGVSTCSAIDEHVGAGAGEDYPRGQFRSEELYLAPVPCLHAASFVHFQFRTGGRSRKGAGHAVLDLRSTPRSHCDSGSRSDCPRDRCGGCSTKWVTLSGKCVNGCWWESERPYY